MPSKIEPNKFGIFITDIYLLNYYGVNVFFQVCGTNEDTVYLCELKTKRTVINSQQVEMLCSNEVCSKDPLIVPRNMNTFNKSTFEVLPIQQGENVVLPIEIPLGSKLYKKACENKSYPIFGTAYAVHIKDWYNKYWTCYYQKRNRHLFTKRNVWYA